MKKSKMGFCSLLACLLSCSTSSAQSADGDFYQFSANTLQGEETNMCNYQGKVILVVNTASKCGFTPQFAGLEELYKKYADQGFVILGFPCNQFMHQEPGDAAAIQNGCMLNYGVTFPMFEKIEVNGKNAHPIYKYLTNCMGGKIKWNFTKFLIDDKGKVVQRYSPATKPADIDADIKALLNKK